MKKKKIIIIVVIIILCMLVGSFGLMWVFNRKGLEKAIEPISNFGKGVITNNNKLTDDWQYKNAKVGVKNEFQRGRRKTIK